MLCEIVWRDKMQADGVAGNGPHVLVRTELASRAPQQASKPLYHRRPA